MTLPSRLEMIIRSTQIVASVANHWFRAGNGPEWYVAVLIHESRSRLFAPEPVMSGLRMYRYRGRSAEATCNGSAK